MSVFVAVFKSRDEYVVPYSVVFMSKELTTSYLTSNGFVKLSGWHDVEQWTKNDDGRGPTKVEVYDAPIFDKCDEWVWKE
ncbi:MAG: hypothetical protein JW740_02575 [Candidatus Zambryskibacteria bacterium]|nr:hypothetical protein [Candidatus Zambryskibacteria bacterium]